MNTINNKQTNNNKKKKIMRRFFKSKPVKFLGLTTTAVAVVSAASFGGWGSGGKKLSSFRTLDGTEFNAIQDTVALQASLAKLPKFEANDEILTLYAMRGCPYCARVRSILSFYGIPFEEVVVDPIMGSELAEHPYKSVPQIQFRKKDPAAAGSSSTFMGLKTERPKEKKQLSEEEIKALHARPPKREDYILLSDGPMIVDSECIVRALSVPLKFDRDLETRAISDPREHIANQFQRYVYVSTHATWARATQAMKTETDPKFHVFPFDRVGGLILYLIATKKVLQRALAQTTLTFAPDATPAQKSDKMLFEYLKSFAAEREKEKYGLKDGTPFNIIDVETYGVLSQVHTLPHVEEIIKDAGADKWLERIGAAVKNHEGKARLLK